MPMENGENFRSFILPKKAVFQLISLLEDGDEKILLFSSDTKMQFKNGSVKITSKTIGGNLW